MFECALLKLLQSSVSDELKPVTKIIPSSEVPKPCSELVPRQCRTVHTNSMLGPTAADSCSGAFTGTRKENSVQLPNGTPLWEHTLRGLTIHDDLLRLIQLQHEVRKAGCIYHDDFSPCA